MIREQWVLAFIEKKSRSWKKFSRRVLGIKIGGSIVVSGLDSSVMNITLVALTYYIHKQQILYSLNVGLFSRRFKSHL